MLISYNKLWKLLIDNKKMNKTDLKDQAGITYNILARLGKCLESLYKICDTFIDALRCVGRQIRLFSL